MLLVDAGMLGGSYSILISAGLLFLNVLMVAAMSHAAARDIRLSQGKAKQLKSLRAQLMVDKREDAQKFAEEWSKLIESGSEGDEGRLLKTIDALVRRAALPNGKQPTPKQTASLVNVDALIEQADEVAPAFHDFLRQLVKENGGDYLQGPNKTRARAVEKIEGDYGGDHTKLVDVVRASAIFVTFVQLTLFVEALLEEGDLVLPLLAVRSQRLQLLLLRHGDRSRLTQRRGRFAERGGSGCAAEPD